MNKLDLTALLEGVRNATGSDRELDAEIAQAVEGVEIQWRQANGTMEMYPVQRYQSTAHAAGFGIGPVPEYTASIDAALALIERVLPEWQYHMGTCGEDDMPWACITEPVDPCRDFAASAPEITIALLTALLSALTSNQEGNDEA